MKSLSTVWTIVVGCYAGLWVGGVIAHARLGGPPEHVSWTAPLFLLLGALISMRVAPGAARLRLVLAGMVGFLAEVIGVHAGYPFGGYHYTNALDPRFLDVPLVMCCAWIVVVAYAQALSAQVALDQPMRTIAGALWLTGLDLLIDPLAAGPLSYWEWHSSGRYYGIPATNFAGWLLVSAIALVAAGPARTVSRTHLNLGISIVIFFVLIAAAMGMVLAVAVGIVLVGVHAFICCAPRERAPLG